jgi:hypothetical protein
LTKTRQHHGTRRLPRPRRRRRAAPVQGTPQQDESHKKTKHECGGSAHRPLGEQRTHAPERPPVRPRGDEAECPRDGGERLHAALAGLAASVRAPSDECSSTDARHGAADEADRRGVAVNRTACDGNVPPHPGKSTATARATGKRGDASISRGCGSGGSNRTPTSRRCDACAHLSRRRCLMQARVGVPRC